MWCTRGATGTGWGRSAGSLPIEVGAGQAMKVQGHFMAVPDPEIALTEASAQLLEEKRAFETQRLKTWFG